jgi:hypothetical protein
MFEEDRDLSKQKASSAVLRDPENARIMQRQHEKGALDTCGFCDERSPGAGARTSAARSA